MNDQEQGAWALDVFLDNVFVNDKNLMENLF